MLYKNFIIVIISITVQKKKRTLIVLCLTMFFSMLNIDRTERKKNKYDGKRHAFFINDHIPFCYSWEKTDSECWGGEMALVFSSFTMIVANLLFSYLLISYSRVHTIDYLNSWSLILTILVLVCSKMNNWNRYINKKEMSYIHRIEITTLMFFFLLSFCFFL